MSRSPDPHPLFRTEALEAQNDTFHGDVLIAHRPGVRLLVTCACAVAVALIAFAWWGQYTRKEHVSGYLAPTLGMIKVYTPQSGTVVESRVAEGQSVKRGDTLMVVSSERASSQAPRPRQPCCTNCVPDATVSVGNWQSRPRSTGSCQEASRTGFAALVRARAGARPTRHPAQPGGQRRAHRGAQSAVARSAIRVGGHGAAETGRTARPARNWPASSASLPGLSGKSTAPAPTSRPPPFVAPTTAPRSAARSPRSSSNSPKAMPGAKSLTAPADGTVTTVLAERGQTVAPDAPLLSILPAGASLEARLLVPTVRRASSIPSSRSHCATRPFHTNVFGHHLGVVSEVGRTVIQPGEAKLPVQVQEPEYMVTVRLPAQAVKAYGQNMALQSGMALDADVRIDSRRLIEWVFDPLLSVAGRV